MNGPIYPSLSLFDGAELRLGRIHEAFGAGARAFAAMTIGTARDGAVAWARPKSGRCVLNPLGLLEFFDPARIVLAECERPVDILWSMEEALRLGAASIVVGELNEPPDLTASRRLQLAAESGGGLGLCLVCDKPMTNAAETRWFCAPALSRESADSTLWRLSLIKNKTGTLGAWEVRWDASSHHIIMVSKIAGGSHFTHGPDRRGPAARYSGGGKKRAEIIRP